ncbi:hypothetical protein NEOLEDRAFT_1079500 [Neolentinus lepideus HHB14362 ss-1]|uniref:Major royal jelly protein n=1 Tax=Neolentinus lepideus HHB14362 ss-1 TaxID=1314782 RepID=A0A165MRK9_9AGAM|nr:hypothetical protein NEOLEDRAFT_1079500 [Neolentinus lepideus HHB14362 ss-1]
MLNLVSATVLVVAAGVLAQGANRLESRWANPYEPFQVYGNASYGPALQLEHLFYDQWPTGLSVASNGQIYANFPTAVNYTNSKFTVGVITSFTTEAAFPSVEYNQPPQGFVNPSNLNYGAGDPDHLVSVQSVVVDALDRVWALDTGRPLLDGSVLYATTGGAKLVGFYQNGTRFANYVLPPTTAYFDTYLNDVRFDLRPSTLPSGKGVAYITDSSNEGRNGIIVIDLGTGNSWRHLDSTPYTRGDPSFISTYDGMTFQPINQEPPAGTYSHLTTGSDGIALSADGAYLYFSPLSSRRLYRVPTSYLLVEPGPVNPNAANAAIAATEFLGLMGGSHADGLETDASGVIYVGACEQNGITMYHPDAGMWMPFIRDPRIQWPDTLSVATNSRLYFTSNQYWRQPAFNNGTEGRVLPYGIFSVPISAGKVILT